MRARHARRGPRLIHEQPARVYNGAYPQKFVQAPILTWTEIRQITACVLLIGVFLVIGLIGLIALVAVTVGAW